MDDIKLSIIVPTYNHERYIEECINSILMQDINFTYEVLIGEDCSKDNTAQVLRGLENRLPAEYTIFYRENNMGMGKTGNAWDLQCRARGEYILTIEGDDFFLDKEKIKKQVEFLDNNPDFIAVTHNCKVVDENSNPNGETYPECKGEEYTFKNYLHEELPGQLATIMYRRIYNQYGEKFYDGFKLYEFYPGDRLKAFLMLTGGRVRCIQEQLSAYRHITTCGTSYSATVTRDAKMVKNELLFYKSIFNYAKYCKNDVAVKTTGKLYFSRLLLRCFGKNKQSKLGSFIREIFSEKHTVVFGCYVIKRTVCLCFSKIKEKLIGA